MRASGNQDAGENRLRLFHRVARTEANHPPAQCLQLLCARGVVFRRLIVLIAIYFNNQLHFFTSEIGNEWPDGLLTPEFQSIEAAVAQALPDFVFAV